MDYAATIDYLFQQLPLFSRIGAAAYKKDLDNIRALCTHLGDPQLRFRTVHVGGTNGKGSVSHMLAAVLQEAGYTTGLYTSPHLYDFRERIRINGELVSEAFVVAFTDRIRPVMEQLQPSFFEITVAMAFEYFAQQQVDVAVIEVGLGGRLDSTNIITPDLSVITNIGWDHMNMLGDTLAAIAGEKAGIIKPGVPVLIGEWQEETAPVFFATAVKNDAPIQFASRRYKAVTIDYDGYHRKFQIENETGTAVEAVEIDLPGIYQEQNVATVYAALQLLREKGYRIRPEHLSSLRETRKRTGLMGRWEQLSAAPRIVLDVAHNPEGLKQLNAQLSGEQFGRLHLVFGMVRDKDVASVLPLLPRDATFYFTQAQIPRALPVEELLEAAATFGHRGSAYPDVNVALEAAVQAAAPEDLVLVCGSIFLVAEVDRTRFTD
ncbi:folylpolyglutamate synthase/dihydrofolate synthase family protein [Flaviaesturariibacter amylovorans]